MPVPAGSGTSSRGIAEFRIGGRTESLHRWGRLLRARRGTSRSTTTEPRSWSSVRRSSWARPSASSWPTSSGAVVQRSLTKRRSAMSAFYKASYRVGFHPWEDLAEHKPFADALMGLFEREESGEGAAVRQGAGPRLRQRDLGRAAGQRGVGRSPASTTCGRARGTRGEAHPRGRGRTCGSCSATSPALLESAVGSGYRPGRRHRHLPRAHPRQRLAMGREVTAIAVEARHRDPRLLRARQPWSAATGVHPGRRGGGVPRVARSPTSSTPTPTRTPSRRSSSSTRCSTAWSAVTTGTDRAGGPGSARRRPGAAAVRGSTAGPAGPTASRPG